MNWDNVLPGLCDCYVFSAIGLRTIGEVIRLATGTGPVTLGQGIAAYLASLPGAEQAGTRRVYGRILARARQELGASTALDEIGLQSFAAWFTATWGERAPSTWNTALAACRSASSYWTAQGWASADPTRMLRPRKQRPDRDRALPREDIEHLLTRPDVSLRDKVLWRLLYETAARAGEILALDVSDLDLANRCARVRRKGGAMDMIVWQTGTARLLPRLLKGRQNGPVFLTERRARVQLPPADLDPASGRARLSYRQAEAIFKAASGGATLHQLRHSALTHDAEDGTSTPMLMARSGHTSVRSLVKYARVSAEALRRHQASRDPARRDGRPR